MTIIVPPVRAAGDPNHIADHNLISSDLADLDAALTSALAAKSDLVQLPPLVMVTAVVAPSAQSGYLASYANPNLFNAVGQLPNQNNYVEWPVSVAAGTYTLRFMHTKAASTGIATFTVDGTALTTVDTYFASTVVGNLTDVTGLMLTAGTHTIRIAALTKNAAASSYLVYFYGWNLTRTGA